MVGIYWKFTIAMKLSVLLLILAVSCIARGDETPEEKKIPDENIEIKIVDSPASRISPIQSTTGNELTLRIKAANISGPLHLQQLAGQCFMLKEGGYEYQVCPFYNVTQKEERVSWNSFYGVLGVWREWIFENDTFVGMHYVMGQECSIGDREVKVLFNCSTMTRLHSTSESSTCHYVIWFDTPLACFKGAMQVYHLLSPEQLKEWEQSEYEYYADEITFQGLTKRRQKMLIKAGLLFDYKKEEMRLAEEKKKKEEQERRKAAETMKNPLTTCQEERDQLRKELDDLVEKIRRVSKDYPAVAYRLGFLQNHTLSKVHSDDIDEAANNMEQLSRAAGEGGGGVQEETVVIDGDTDGVIERVLAILEDGDGDDRRGGENIDDEMVDIREDELDDILREINAQAEENDLMELKKELVDLHSPEEGKNPVKTEGEREERVGHTEDSEIVEQRDIDTDKQLLELIEQMKNAQEAQEPL